MSHARSVADHVAVARLGDLRPLPERRRQRLEAERRVERLRLPHHPRRIVMRLRQQLAGVVADIAGTRRSDQVVDVAPFLPPHVAEQVGADRAGRGLHRGAVALVQLHPHMGVERAVQRLDLVPQPVGHRLELGRAHVIAGTPQRAGVGIAELPRALVGQRDRSRVILPHRCADIVVPADPHLAQPRRITLGTHRRFDVAAADRLAGARAVAATIARRHARHDR